ncbi:Hypothetical protein SRAE_0000053100 [Strongyloides ratti]|uniref:Uncharacterized protein n=1 Tax=Strongyloides ratti TaxID=34506 RepID=A0A090KZV0_STRRB|nr:Hypothetical protein SRAE_0000053100 [Strongyloides ratti]CEF61407.1 Hypothetical protein SRAE_0000053100 [Strongyloides ratti]
MDKGNQKIIATTNTIKNKGQMQLKSYYNHCLLKHKKTTRIDKEINTRIENIEINQPIINEKNFEGNFGTDLLIENEDLFQEDFCDFNIENVNE